MNILLKIARQVLRTVLGEITRQVQVVQQQVLDAIMRDVANVDEIWVGEGAEAFKAEASGMVQNRLNEVIGLTTRTHQAIIQAEERMTQADQQVQNLVSNLVSEYTQVYH
ncbi:MAG: WXG100 family type VII secretion target [Anaerolineae bacterium]|nr:WXG100 family type VII secretion target [Anaerolineae bacterium]MCA9891676.1 WXG100 family type VII secretion target [Anaerolineae bacterium]